VEKESQADMSEREILFKVLFELKNDMNDLKKLVMDIIENNGSNLDSDAIKRLYPLLEGGERRTSEMSEVMPDVMPYEIQRYDQGIDPEDPIYDSEIVEESLSIEEKEKELIKKALEKHRGKRKSAAQELGISERTLYRKIKEYGLN